MPRAAPKASAKGRTSGKEPAEARRNPPAPAEPRRGRGFPDQGRARVVIEGVSPEVDGGRFPAKRVAGDAVAVEADIFGDGHDALAAVLLHRPEGREAWEEAPMEALPNDRWRGVFPVPAVGRYRFTILAWVDRFGSWRRDLAKKDEAGQDVRVDLLAGAALVEAAAARAKGPDADKLAAAARALRAGAGTQAERVARALDPGLADLVSRHDERAFATAYAREVPVAVDPPRARASAWYEMFPRSTSPDPSRPGTLRDCAERLPYVAAMGFDVLYLPPIHPIGRAHRKGRNNDSSARPGDPGSPWAIGGPEGGHKAVDPGLGTLKDFEVLVARARDLGIDVAMDIAFQCSPDHPYVKEHPQWFRRRPDGSVQYAENPPKKYQDIYPFDFETEDWPALWEELRSVFAFWAERGVRIFRVDNPHTKPFPFWEWCIGELKREHPDLLFLAEAFTRPKVMYRLAKLGFTHSYTYFAWRTTKWELTQYFTELTQTEAKEHFRPHLWPNTPDILTAQLQNGGRPAFMQRLILAATLGANYGIYGPAFELCEHKAVAPGKEEYLDSEKYEVKHWDLEQPHSLRDLVARMNRVRRDNPALLGDRHLAFHPVENEHLLAYSKRTEDRSNVVLTVVNLDPHHTQAGMTALDLGELGVPHDQTFQVHDLLTGARYLWHGPRNYVELNPHTLPAHVFRVRRKVQTEQDFDYYA